MEEHLRQNDWSHQNMGCLFISYWCHLEIEYESESFFGQSLVQIQLQAPVPTDPQNE